MEEEFENFQKKAILIQFKDLQNKFKHLSKENEELKLNLNQTKLQEYSDFEEIKQKYLSEYSVLSLKNEELNSLILDLKKKLIRKSVLKEKPKEIPQEKEKEKPETIEINGNIEQEFNLKLEEKEREFNEKMYEKDKILKKFQLQINDLSNENMRLIKMHKEYKRIIENEEHLKAKIQLKELQESMRNEQQIFRNEEEKRRRILEADIKKMNQDLSRLRQNRDALQKQLDLNKTTSDKALAEARKQKIEFLESEIQRLMMCVAGEAGERGLMAFFSENRENPYQIMAAKLHAAYEKLGIQDIEVDKPPTDSLEDMKTLLETKTKSEQRLMQELQTLGQAWSTLEQQVESGSENDFNKTVQEKLRLEHKVASLQKQIQAFHNTFKAQKNVNDKQLEQIRKMEELEKNNQKQLKNMEGIVAKLGPEIQQHTTDKKAIGIELGAMIQQHEEAKQRGLTLQATVEQLQDSIFILEQGNKRYADEVGNLKRRVERLQKDGNGELQDQLEQYRSLTMCSSCNNAFKSHLLLKCMHTFCKGCIDDLTTSRQRKCPTCGQGFGKEDIKQFYL